MKYLKNYIRYDTDGFIGERKLAQLDHGEISMQISLETTLIPFAMDRTREEFVIFRIDRGKSTGRYIWVYLQGDFKGKKIRVTMINELMLHSKWTDEPMDVSGNFPDEAVTRAIQLLQTWADEEIWIEMKELDEWMHQGGNDPMWQEDEAHILKEIKTARKEHNSLMFMY